MIGSSVSVVLWSLRGVISIFCHAETTCCAVVEKCNAVVCHMHNSTSSHCCNMALHTHTPPFNGPLTRTTRVSQYQKGKTNLDFTEARDSEWQWHQLGHMQVCTSLQTDNHANTPPLSFYGPDALPAAQPTASKHWKVHMFTTCDWQRQSLPILTTPTVQHLVTQFWQMDNFTLWHTCMVDRHWQCRNVVSMTTKAYRGWENLTFTNQNLLPILAKTCMDDNVLRAYYHCYTNLMASFPGQPG